MKKLKLIRHGESCHNRDGVIQGQIDSELTETGLSQAESLSQKISAGINIIYTSELQRAYKTAEVLGERCGAEVERREALNERHLGFLQGEDCSIWSDINIEDGWRPEGGETYAEHVERVFEVVEEIKSLENEKVALVAHSGTIYAILNEIVDDLEVWYQDIDNCSVTELVFDGESWEIAYFNQSLSEG